MTSIFNIDWENDVRSAEELVVVDWQAELFESCQSDFGVDAFAFINAFMQSHIAQETDQKGVTAQLASSAQVVLCLYPDGTPPLDVTKNPEALYWIGYLYRSWAFMGTSSQDIIKIAPVEKAYILYKGYHCLDVLEAIGRFIESWQSG
jgi:hypothetical protein